MKTVNMIAWILLIVGGLNWGLVGIFQFDLVAALLGAGSMLSNVVYILVGVSAVLAIFGKKGCGSDACEMKTEAPAGDSQM
jgi:uncharacterized membrane protein YuzA (DUF378 family)